MLDVKNIPVFILAGGLGTRLSEDTQLKPKPMVQIGDLPILVHIMQSYYHFGFNDFVICAGYKSSDIKNYFLNDELIKKYNHEKWRVRIIDTGLEAMTGCRIARAFDEISTKQAVSQFAVTYGDGLTNVNLTEEHAYHQKHGKIGTVLGVPPISRFGLMKTSKAGEVLTFLEKPEVSNTLINGGFFFFNSKIRSYLNTDEKCTLEQEPLQNLVKDKELNMFEHRGFWQCMDTTRDKNILQELWEQNKAPWIFNS